MQYQMARHLPRGSRVRELATGEIYIVEKIEDKKQFVMIYGREERTKRTKSFDHRKVEKISLIREMHQMIEDKSLYDWKKDVPVIYEMLQYKEQLWINPKRQEIVPKQIAGLGMAEIEDARKRLIRFAPYIKKAFPETEQVNGRISSALIQIPKMLEQLKEDDCAGIKGSLYLKCDSHLAISGSIKARGGIYEVLFHAEQLAIQNGFLKETDNYSILCSEDFQQFYSNYTIAVGSTGNLGLSIGIMAAKLGFQAVVHMSADAKEWKKQLLREKGVTVVEYSGDYGKAVAQGREDAKKDVNCYFIDDENSKTLFLGYAAAALELKEQLNQMHISADEEHPLFVYLPCGVGGGPGGVTFGLKQVFGAHVHCFFAEPTHSPCMMLGLATGYHNRLSVQDFGLDNRTEADGLAVGRASGFVGKVMEPILDGCYTINDERLFVYLKQLAELEGRKLEPSALAGMRGPYQMFGTKQGRDFLMEQNLLECEQITHIVWATGGGMVPQDIMQELLAKG